MRVYMCMRCAHTHIFAIFVAPCQYGTQRGTHMYVCEHACVCVCMRICSCKCMLMWMRICTHVSICVQCTWANSVYIHTVNQCNWVISTRIFFLITVSVCIFPLQFLFLSLLHVKSNMWSFVWRRWLQLQQTFTAQLCSTRDNKTQHVQEYTFKTVNEKKAEPMLKGGLFLDKVQFKLTCQTFLCRACFMRPTRKQLEKPSKDLLFYMFVKFRRSLYRSMGERPAWLSSAHMQRTMS